MAYNAAIPQPTDQLSASQGAILDNFTSINTAWLVNHGDFNGGNAGNHMFVTLPTIPNAQVAAVPTMAGNQIGLASLVSALSGVPEMQVIRPGTNVTVEFTSADGASVGWTRLPSGILLKWGQFVMTAASTPYVYPVAGNIPVFTAVYQTLLTPQSRSGAVISFPPYLVSAGYGVTGFSVAFNVAETVSANKVIEYLTIGA